MRSSIMVGVVGWWTVAALYAAPRVQPIDLTKGNAAIQQTAPGVCEWNLPEGQPQTAQINLDALGINPGDFDELRFELKPLGSQVGLHTALTAFPTARDKSSWYLKSKTPVGEWSEVRFELRKDDDGALLPENKESARVLSLTLDRRVIGFPGEPNWRKAQFRNFRLVRNLVSVGFDLAETKIEETDKEIAYTYSLIVSNRMDKPLRARLDPDSARTLKAFRVEAPTEIALKPGESAIVPVRLSTAKSRPLPPLYAESAIPRVTVEDEADSDVAPLMGYRRRVLWAAIPAGRGAPFTPEAIQQAAKQFPLEAWQARSISAAAAALRTEWPVPPADLMPPGYDQGYRCEKCGEWLKPVEPTSFCRHTCPKCNAVVEGRQWIDRCYVAQYLSARCDDIHALAWAWLLTGKEAYAGKAIEMMLALAKAYPAYPTPGLRSTAGGARFSFATLHSAYQLPKLAEAFAFLHDAPGFDAEKKAAIRRMLIEEACRVSWHGTEYNNQGAEHGRAFGSVGLATGFWPLTAQAVHGEFAWHDLIENAFSEDGINHEGTAYHVAIFLCMSRFAAFANQYGVNLLTDRAKRVYDGSLALGLGSAYPTSYEPAYRAYREPAYLPGVKTARNAPDDLTLLSGVPELPDITKLAFASVHLPTSGYIFLRRGTVADHREIRLNYRDAFDRNERDRFSTAFYRNGQRVDSTVGRIIYTSPQAMWMMETAAHNAIVVDGASQREIAGRLLAYQPDGDTPIAVVTDAGASLYEGVTQVRGIALIGDAYIVFDRVSADKPRTFDRYQYGMGAATLTPAGGRVASLPLLPGIGQFTGIEGGLCGKEARVTFAGNHLHMRLVSDRDMACYKAQTVGGYQAQPMEATFARVEGMKDVTFLAGFREGKEVEPPTLAIRESRPERLEFTVTVAGTSHRIRVNAVSNEAVVASDP
jgi:hypothetical protein